MTARTFITLAELRKCRGVTIPQVRVFERTDSSFPAVDWTGERSGMIVLAEFDEWFSTRAERAARARESEQRRREFVGGSGVERLPRFKRGSA